MSRMDRHRGTLEARILYWGPSASGKSETLDALQRSTDPEGRSTLLHLAAEDGSTAFFDILALEEFRYGGQRMRISVCAAPGGFDRAAERRALLRTADAIVFVADAQRSALADNRASARELEETLAALGRRRNEVPVIWSFNKQDGGECVATRELREMLVPGTDPVYETVAVQGQGVFESFRETFRQLLHRLARRHGLEPEPEDRDGLPEQLLPQLARRTGSGPSPRGARESSVVRLTIPTEDLPANERALETMLAMAARQAEQGERMRMVEARNSELMAVNRVARSILSAMEIDNLLVVLLDATTERLGVTHASVVMFDPTRDGALRTHVTGFGKDPALGLEPAAARRFFEIMRESDGPIPADPVRDPELYAALQRVDRRLTGAIFHPIKMGATTPSGWIAIYYLDHARRPGAQGLLFLSSISRLASLGLEKISQYDAMMRDRQNGEAEVQEMAARLELSESKARSHKSELEARVEERTRGLRQELRRARQGAAESAHRARLRGMAELAESFAREVNAPLRDLMGQLQAMRERFDVLRSRSDDAGVQAVSAALDTLLDGCVRGAERVEGVAQSLGRLGSGEDAESSGFSLNAAVADAVTLLEGRIEGCAELELRLGKIARLEGDEADLSQAVHAVLVNALEAVERTGSRGKIVVTTYADADRVVLRISDNGPGIEPELLPQVCEPFVTTKSRENGAGLGLHAAREALRAQGGELRVTSKPGEGTSVTACFSLPVESPLARTGSTPDAAD